MTTNCKSDITKVATLQTELGARFFMPHKAFGGDGLQLWSAGETPYEYWAFTHRIQE
jgi:hypothetical protein